ncbi:MAG TPA: hypothetical protein DDW27_18830 [Bacteroidales bacterium]|nr:hypothetical protein [Bacteroidales bacterium]
MEDKIIEAACNAFHNASPAEAGFTVADGTGAGTNRHNPSGPADLEIPVVIIRNPDKHIIACMLVCNMHPTVLHEDSKLYSGDFPAFLRETLQKKYFNCECPVLYFTGAAGNQSPRHVTQSNTFEEARRIGGLIANAVALKIIKGIEYSSEISVLSLQKFVDLPRRKFSDPESAKEQRDKSFERFEHLKRTSANKQEIRTAEVNWFGAEESLHFATLAQSQDFEDIYKTCLPAEIQIIKIGKWNFAAWPGEVYIEYEIELKKKLKDTFLITLANGELQGYIATEEAEKNGYYEALNSFFHYTAGSVLVEETIRLIKSLE